MLKINLIIKQTGNFAKVEAVPESLDGSNDAISEDDDRFNDAQSLASYYDYETSDVEQEDDLIDDEDPLAYIDDVDNDPDFGATVTKKRKRGSRRSMNSSVPLKTDVVSYFRPTVKDEENCDDNASKDRVCPFCNMTCKSWQGMRRHIGHVHKENGGSSKQRAIICDCGESFSKNHNGKKLFRAHRANCSFYMKSAFICEFCETPFHEIPALNNHKYKVHGINYERLTCLCGQTFTSSCSRRKHSLECNLYKSAAVFCEVCKSPFLTANHLRQHFRSTGHGDAGDLSDVDSSTKTVLCKCGKVFSRYNKHLWRDHREKCPDFLKEGWIHQLLQS
ncbi:oocyte zinc finger protein XlCOF6-like protein [Dinothrombium tinctorium]|uniref:Oocyte zinc finger protein XlCOF6-like protein n=1 Tax=Dinothrombium tinctorium TaxID=1965070 RepID=A0A3S3PHN8_9ACAR|nr:oocyte zinc finger protein XlCOF6-like protein [Dinothrombium tinctorium]